MRPPRPSWASPLRNRIVGFLDDMTLNPTIGGRWAGAVAALGALAAVVGLGGCASGGSGVEPGERVDVYVSMPLRGPDAPDGRDVVDGARLALADAGGRAGELEVRASYLDDTSGAGPDPSWDAAAAAANARQATQDSAAIAYIGDFDSGATRFSLPITNEAHLLQVSPASAAVDLVQPYLGAGDQIPEEVQPTEERTFGRVIPSDEAQAQAGAVWAKRLGVKDAAVARDDSSFGRVMAPAFTDAARAIHLHATATKKPLGLFAPATPRGATACPAFLLRLPLLYYAGVRIPTGLVAPCSGSIRYPHGVMATDALMSAEALRILRSKDLRLTSAAEDPSQLPPQGQRFLRAFRERYDRQPGRYAAYGYEAMAVVLDSIERAGDSGDDRDAVVDAFFDTTDRRSILGTYSIDEVGNTTLNRLAGYRVVDGRPRFETGLSVTP
jgi:branched-chain amino acid transport system substrate-binding protein